MNQSFVDRYLGEESAIGQRIALGSPDRRGPWTEIVGVVADHHNAGATRPKRPEIYTPVRQQTDWNQLFVLVSSDGDAAALLPVGAGRGASRSTPSSRSTTCARWKPPSRRRRSSSGSRRCCWRYLPAVALLLAAVGIFGVLSYSVSARTQEIGVRIAVGAEPSDVRWLVLRQVLVLTGIGLAIGAVVLGADGAAAQRAAVRRASSPIR